MRFRGPLADSYPAAAGLVVLALVPYLVLSSAFTPLLPALGKSLHLSPQALQLASGMANAAYAFGTVLSVQFAQHFPQRRLLVGYAALFVFGSVMAATALTPGLFIAGHVLQGLSTSLMLIAAVPPLIIGWPTSRMRYTAVVMNLCIFGAVALGPVIGGVQAGAADWRPLFWIIAAVAVAALFMTLLTFEDAEPQDRSAPWDWVAVLLAGGGCAAAFFGASELQTHRLLEVLVLLPLLAGVAMLVALVLVEGLLPRALMPVRQLTTTLPLIGVVVAMAAGAASVAIVELVQTAFKTRTTPLHLGMLFWPEFGGAVATALVFGAVFRTRFVPFVAFAGMTMLAGGAALLSGVAHGPQALVVIGSGLVGIGVGASVSPALFIAGFSIPSAQIQRVFALVELLRGVAAFMFAPIILHLVMTVGGGPPAAIGIGMWVCFGIAAGGGLIAVYLFWLGRARLQRPDLDRWQDGEAPAWDSPRLAAGIRDVGPLRVLPPPPSPASPDGNGSRPPAGARWAEAPLPDPAAPTRSR